MITEMIFLKPIVIYCSQSGITEALAKNVASDLSCNIIKIEPEKEYKSSFSAIIRASREKILNEKPGYKTALPDLSDCDTILFGYPIWCFEPPKFAVAFMQDCNLDGKRIIPFSTSGGTHISKTLPFVEKICSAATVELPFNRSISKSDDYDEWINQIKNIL